MITRRRTAAGMLGLIALAAAVWWFMRPDAERPAPRAEATPAVAATPVVPPQSPAPGAVQAPDRSMEVDSPRHRAATAALKAYRAWLAERLAAEDTARSLALAVHLLTIGQGYDPSEVRADLDPRVPRWFARARAIAGDDGVAWALLTSVPAGRIRPSGEFAEAVVLEWAEHDAYNLAPWAYLPGDTVGPEAWLDRARSPRAHFTMHWLDAQAVVLDAYRRYPPPSEWRVLLMGEGGWKEDEYPLDLADPIMLPAFQRIVAACRTRDQRTHAPAGCAELGRAMIERSDSLVTAAIGVLLVKEAAPGRQLPADLHAAHRRMRWVRDQFLRLDEATVRTRWSEYLTEPMPLTEAGVFIHVLEREGVRTTPPAGWNPPEPR